MTAGAINDPDLVQAIEELQFVVSRLEQLHQQVNELDEVEGYSRIVKMRTEIADLRDTIRVRAEKLNIPPRALAMVIGTANKLRTNRKRQLPTLAVVKNHIAIVQDAAAREQAEAEAEVKTARVVARGAAMRAKAGTDAIAYLEASRS